MGSTQTEQPAVGKPFTPVSSAVTGDPAPLPVNVAGCFPQDLPFHDGIVRIRGRTADRNERRLNMALAGGKPFPSRELW